MKLALIPTLLLFPLTLAAAPALQMHVFDENAATVQPDDTKPALQIHVFPNMAGVQPDHAPLKQHRQSPPPKKSAFLAYDRADFYVRTGYRRDQLDWNIAGPNNAPNILSELKWKDIEIAEIRFGTTLYTEDNWVFSLDAGYGRIYDGDNQDSDYLGNNRTLEFSRSNNGADQGEVYDVSISAGHRYRWQHDLESGAIYSELRPLLGLSYHAQNLKIVDGFQTIPAFGAFSGLDSSYDAAWFGPWIGLDGLLEVNERWALNLGVEYHYAWYDATANWNLRPDFAHPESFTHEAKGTGWVTSLNSNYQFSPSLGLNIGLDYQLWKADKDGVDRTFFANGTNGTVKFNEVNWRSFGANIGLIYEF